MSTEPPITADLAAMVASSQEARVANRFRAVAEGLRQIADQVEREARRDRPAGKTPGARTPYSTTAGQIAHAVMWGVANLGLDTLTRDAAEADVYRALADHLPEEEVPNG